MGCAANPYGGMLGSMLGGGGGVAGEGGQDLLDFFGFPPLKLDFSWSWKAPRPTQQLVEKDSPAIPARTQGIAETIDARSGHETADKDTGEDWTIVRSLIAQVTACSDLEDVKVLSKTLSLPARLEVTFSGMAFDQLLDRASERVAKAGYEWSGSLVSSQGFVPVVGELGQFLESGADIPEAGNTAKLLAWIERQNQGLAWTARQEESPVVLNQVVDLVCDKILLDTINGAGLKTAITSLSGILQQASVQASVAQNLHAWYQRIWAAVSASFVAPHDRKTEDEVRQQLVVAICSSRSSSRQLLSLAIKIHKQCQIRGQLSTNGNIAHYLARWAQHYVTHALPEKESDSNAPLAGPMEWDDLIDSLSPRNSGSILSSATVMLINNVCGRVRMETDVRSFLNSWLSSLARCQHMARLYSNEWRDVFTLLGQHFDPSDFPSYFKTLSATDAAKIILQHWVCPMLAADNKRLHSTRKVISKGRVRFDLSHFKHPSPHPAVPVPRDDQIRRISIAFEERLARYIEQVPAVTAPFVAVAAVVANHGQPYAYFLEEVFRLLTQYSTPRHLYTLSMNLIREGVRLPTNSALFIMDHFTRTGNAGYALRIFEASPHIWASQCPDLIAALIAKGRIHTLKIFSILNRPEFFNSVPGALRTRPTNALSDERVRAVEVVAFSLAQSPHMNPREAFRAVHDCYRYLRDRDAPLSPLLSRALVLAGVVRPLQAGLWVSTIKFRWILHWVRILEGEDVAQRLDELAYALRERVGGRRARDPLLDAFRRSSEEVARTRAKGLWTRYRWKRRKGLWRPGVEESEHVPAPRWSPRTAA